MVRRFAFVCQADGFETAAVLPHGDPYRWPGLRTASIDIAVHCLGAHDGDDGVAFERVWLEPPAVHPAPARRSAGQDDGEGE